MDVRFRWWWSQIIRVGISIGIRQLGMKNINGANTISEHQWFLMQWAFSSDSSATFLFFCIFHFYLIVLKYFCTDSMNGVNSVSVHPYSPFASLIPIFNFPAFPIIFVIVVRLWISFDCLSADSFLNLIQYPCWSESIIETLCIYVPGYTFYSLPI